MFLESNLWEVFEFFWTPNWRFYVIIYTISSSLKFFPVKPTPINKWDCWYMSTRYHTDTKQHGNGKTLTKNFTHTYLCWVPLHFVATRDWSSIQWKNKTRKSNDSDYNLPLFCERKDLILGQSFQRQRNKLVSYHHNFGLGFWTKNKSSKFHHNTYIHISNRPIFF